MDMIQGPAQEATLPEATHGALEEVCAQLRGALGPELVGVLLYGSAARGDWEQGVSDINLMVVTERADVPVCDRIVEPLRAAQRRLPLDVELVTVRDLERSTDVFPLRFLDIQRDHVLLDGRNPLVEVDIAWDHLRLRVEQQIKALLLSLRRAYLLHSDRPERLDRALTQGISTFLLGVGALLFLRDGQWWVAGKQPIAQAAITQLGLDEALLTSLLDLQRRRIVPDPEQLRALYDQFLGLVEQVAELVDQLEEDDDEGTARAPAASTPAGEE